MASVAQLSNRYLARLWLKESHNVAALVYGGRSPIALALCEQLAASGQEVHLVTRHRDETIVKLASDHHCKHVHECDLEDAKKSIALALEIDNKVDGLDAVAFMHRYRTATSNPIKQYEVEVYTPYEILESLASQSRVKQCAVVLTTSPAARNIVGDQDFQYHASKAALSQLVRFGAVRFASKNLRINGVSPGSFIFKQRAADFYAKNPEVVARANKLIPLARMGTVVEIANVASFLLSDKSSYMNGQILEVDGGLSNFDQASLTKPD
ncbi:MAG: SDR family oxidoreductase [Oxalobacteraceae bacterium]|nr:SDR family oxidoreductase [Oxalobacteraceae bacterium]